ncbi:MAG: hypothetical protein ABI203_04900 [Mucilaginibacter sp.]
MENWDYYISGIWKKKVDDIEYISDVFLHSTVGGFGKGAKISKDEVVGFLKNGAKITTITWNYHLIQWRFGAKVEYDEVKGDYFLRTQVGASTFDDLESSIQLEYILEDQPVISPHH